MVLGTSLAAQFSQEKRKQRKQGSGPPPDAAEQAMTAE